jgi:DNA polymerase III epsilon subunit-like protein
MLEKAADYVALDLETTGLNPREDMIIEIGKVHWGQQDGKFFLLC